MRNDALALFKNSYRGHCFLCHVPGHAKKDCRLAGSNLTFTHCTNVQLQNSDWPFCAWITRPTNVIIRSVSGYQSRSRRDITISAKFEEKGREYLASFEVIPQTQFSIFGASSGGFKNFGAQGKYFQGDTLNEKKLRLLQINAVLEIRTSEKTMS